MILVWLIIILVATGLLAGLAHRLGDRWPRWIALMGLTAYLAMVLGVWWQHFGQPGAVEHGVWLIEFEREWIPQLGTSFLLALDGLSLLLLALTGLLGIAAVLASWREISEHVGFFHFNLMLALAGITGVFLAIDLFLFYFFWEVMLVPAYFLFLWGSKRRVQAGLRFIIFTQVGSLLMLLAMVGLYFVHGLSTGIYTFDYRQLLGTSLEAPLAMWLMLGFFVAFAVKLPAFPFHSWLPDAYAEAPTAGTVILAGLMAKTAGYGMLRFVLPMFPEAAEQFAPIAMGMAAAGILYGALLAFAQTDLKRLVACTSVSHMGFVLLGAFAGSELALQGVVVQMIAHGVSIAALFILVGALEERLGTSDITRMGGLWAAAPRMGAVGLFLALATLGLPGLGNFVGEFLVLLGAYSANVPLAIIATMSVIIAAVYALRLVQRVFHGPSREGRRTPDLSGRETAAMAVAVVALVWLGLFPQTVLDTSRQALFNVGRYAGYTAPAAGASPLQVQPSAVKDLWQLVAEADGFALVLAREAYTTNVASETEAKRREDQLGQEGRR